MEKKKSCSKNDQFTGHFQSFFFNISRNNSKSSMVNQQPVSNLCIFHFTKNLDLTVSLSKIQRQNLKNILFLSTKQIIFRDCR